MKSFLKLIVSIFVIGLAGYTVYFFLNSNVNYEKNNISSDIESGNVKEEISGDVDKEIVLSPAENYENISGEIEEVPNNSGETIFVSGDDIASLIDKINMIETKNRLANVSKNLEEELGIDIMGTHNKDLFEAFTMDTMSANVQVAGTMTYIIPASDFANNAQYHYDENGNLKLYISELMGIGGSVRYYFNDTQLLQVVPNIEEEIELKYEEGSEILQRAELIYNKYMK